MRFSKAFFGFQRDHQAKRESAFQVPKGKTSYEKPKSECLSILGNDCERKFDAEVVKYLQESLLANKNRPQTSQTKLRKRSNNVSKGTHENTVLTKGRSILNQTLKKGPKEKSTISLKSSQVH